MSTEIADDAQLLDTIMQMANSAPELYRPGPYWRPIARNSERQIRRHGLEGFRGDRNSVGLSYADNILTDVRLAPGPHRQLKNIWFRLPPVRQTVEAQKALTDSLKAEILSLQGSLFSNSVRVLDLLGKYEVSDLDTCVGKPVRVFNHKQRSLSCYYLEMLDLLDHALEGVRNRPTSALEIGGGFGAAAHILTSSFGVRKYLYVDIAPNLYVATQFLKSHYGDAVTTAVSFGNQAFEFSSNSDLEIFCILPHQLENFSGKVDLAWNSHSFVEMPVEAVRNYASLVRSKVTSNSGVIAMASYQEFDPKTTFDPALLPEIFQMTARTFERLSIDGTKKNLFHAIRLE